MAQKLGEAYVRIFGDDTDLNKALNESKRNTRAWIRDIGQGIAQGLGQAVFGALSNGVRAAVGEIGKAAKAASDLNETVAKTSAVYGDNSREVLEWSKNSANAFGLSREAALNNASALGNMFLQLGAGRKDAAVLSQDMIKLAADLTSFHNVAGGTEEVLQAMQSAFRGEYDALQRYIPTINAATVEQRAMAMSGKDSAKELTALEKALAAQEIIMRGAGAATGAYARELGSAASQQRIFNAHVQDARAQLGQVLVPIQGALFRGLNQLIEMVRPYGANIINSLAEGMARAVHAVIPALVTLRAVFVRLLKPGSPPKLLPELTDWGQGAVQAWLDGWTKGDFGALRTLGNAVESILRSFVGTGQLAETDLVARVFGSQRAIAQAVAEWRAAGRVSETTLAAIRRAAGPAGDSIAALIDRYFELEGATRRAAEAQRRLDEVTRLYDSRLNPLQDKLSDLQKRQQEIRDNQRLRELGEIINDPNADADERRLARLEAEEIRLRQKISAVEDERDAAVDAEQEKLDAAKKQEEAAREALEREQAALDQIIQNNSLIAEEISLRERLANEALAKQEEALRKLEAAQREAEQAEKEARAEAERHARELENLYQAQLGYNLLIADTPGKIALLKMELGRYKEGSVEYYDVLGQIYSLEKQLAAEREKLAGSGGAGDPFAFLEESLGENGTLEEGFEGVNKLTEALDELFTQLFGKKSANPTSLSDILREDIQPAAAASTEDVDDFVEALRGLAEAVGAVVPPLKGLAEIFGVELPDSAEEGGRKTQESSSSWMKLAAADAKFYAGLISGDWSLMWEGLKERAATVQSDMRKDENTHWTNFKRNLTELATAFGTWLSTTWTAISSWFTTTTQAFVGWLLGITRTVSEYKLDGGASAMLQSFLDGLKTKWLEVSAWWSEKVQWFKDQIPTLPSWLGGGSAQGGGYNAPSYQSGGSLAGMSMALPSLATLPAPTSAVTNHHNATASVNLNFYGNVTPDTIRKGVRTADDELKQRGYK